MADHKKRAGTGIRVSHAKPAAPKGTLGKRVTNCQGKPSAGPVKLGAPVGSVTGDIVAKVQLTPGPGVGCSPGTGQPPLLQLNPGVKSFSGSRQPPSLERTPDVNCLPGTRRPPSLHVAGPSDAPQYTASCTQLGFQGKELLHQPCAQLGFQGTELLHRPRSVVNLPVRISPAVSGLSWRSAPQSYSISSGNQRLQYLRWLHQHDKQRGFLLSGVAPVPAASPPAARRLVIAASTPGAAPVPYRASISTSRPPALGAEASLRLQQYHSSQKERLTPFLEQVSAIGSSIENSSNCSDVPQLSYPAFTAAASHGRANVSELSGVPFGGQPSDTSSQRSSKILQDARPMACCGMPLQSVSIAQLFSGKA